MGLDISIRYRRIDAKPIRYEEWYGKTIAVYDEVDLHREDVSFQGRSEFAAIRKWVGDERYGDYIPLIGENYESLMYVLREAIEQRIEEEKQAWDCYPGDDFPWFLDAEFGIERLFSLVLKAPIYAEYGWYMELECDW